jgi:iron complex outermembrane receptor protein
MRRISTYLCAGASLLSLAVPAMAQTGQVIDETPPAGTQLPTSEPEGADIADDTGELAPSNEIVVSARRRTESVQDVPQTVNVVTAAQVEKLNLRNFTEIASVVPGLQLQSQGAFSNSATVRGVAFNPEASGGNPSVEFYLNDAPISSAFLFQSTFDFGQFELQRGPQGTLRGRAAPSGSIAVTTRRPDLDEVGAVFNGTITDLHARKLDGAFNIPIISNVLGVRVAGVIDNNRAGGVRSTSEVDNPEFSERPFSRTKSIRASVRFEPSDWAQFNFMYQNLHSERHTYDQLVSERLINPAVTTGTSLLIRPFDRLGTGEQGAYNRQDQEVYIGNADFQFAGQRLSYVGAYNSQDNGSIAPQDTGNFFAPPRVNIVRRTGVNIAGFDPICTNEARLQSIDYTTGTYNQCTHQQTKRESHELRLASEERIAGIFDYVAGVFYDRNNTPTNLVTESVNVSSIAVLTNPAAPFTVIPAASSGILRRGVSTEKSAFVNVTAHLLDDALEVSGGLRYIDYKNRNSTLQVSGTGAVECPGFSAVRCSLVSSDSDNPNATVYTGSVKYKITRDVMVYALTGSSWRPGPRVVGDFSATNNLEADFLVLPPERSKSYEIGAKTSFLDGRGRFNIAAYHQKFKNYPFRSPSVFYVCNGTAANCRGLPGPTVVGFSFVAPVPVTVKGVEGELSFDITDRWSLGLNAAYADGKIKNGTVACTDLNGDGIPDINPPQPTVAQLQASLPAGATVGRCNVTQSASAQPKFSANVQSEYGFDVGENTDAFVRGLYSFFGKTINDPANALDNVGAYGLLNLYAGIRDKDGAWELTLFGKNITKEREILTVGNTLGATNIAQPRVGAAPPPAGVFNSEYRSVSVTAPREFGITAKIALGSR